MILSYKGINETVENQILMWIKFDDKIFDYWNKLFKKINVQSLILSEWIYIYYS